MEKEIFSKSYPVQFIDEEAIVTETTTYSEWVDSSGFESFVAGVYLEGSKGQISSLVVQGSDLAGHGDAALLSNDYLLYDPDVFPAVAATPVGQLLFIGCIAKTRYFRVGFVSANNGGSVALKLVGAGLLSDSKSQPSRIENSNLSTSEINAPAQEADSIVTAPKRTV